MKSDAPDTQTTPLPCYLIGCGKPRVQKSKICNMHRTRMQRYGSYNRPPKSSSGMTPEERFWHYVAKAPSGHWVWTGPVLGRKVCDYGRVFLGPRAKPKQALAHRFAYELLIGPIPPGLEIDHLCRYTMCVNPLHLQPVTHAVNVARGDLMKPHVRARAGESNRK